MNLHVTVHGTIEHVFRKRRKRNKVALILCTLGPVQEQILPGPDFEVAMTQLTETQQATGTVKPETKKHNPAQVESSTFASSDPAVFTTEQDAADPLKVTVKAVAPGVGQLQWSFDSRLGDEVNNVTVVLADIVVVAGEAAGGTIAFDAAVEQP